MDREGTWTPFSTSFSTPLQWGLRTEHESPTGFLSYSLFGEKDSKESEIQSVWNDEKVVDCMKSLWPEEYQKQVRKCSVDSGFGFADSSAEFTIEDLPAQVQVRKCSIESGFSDSSVGSFSRPGSSEFFPEEFLKVQEEASDSTEFFTEKFLPAPVPTQDKNVHAAYGFVNNMSNTNATATPVRSTAVNGPTNKNNKKWSPPVPTGSGTSNSGSTLADAKEFSERFGYSERQVRLSYTYRPRKGKYRIEFN